MLVTCCNVLQWVAVCCGGLQCVAVQTMWQWLAVWAATPLYLCGSPVAVCCSVLQGVVTRMDEACYVSRMNGMCSLYEWVVSHDSSTHDSFTHDSVTVTPRWIMWHDSFTVTWRCDMTITWLIHDESHDITHSKWHDDESCDMPPLHICLGVCHDMGTPHIHVTCLLYTYASADGVNESYVNESCVNTSWVSNVCMSHVWMSHL